MPVVLILLHDLEQVNEILCVSFPIYGVDWTKYL